MVYNFYMPGWRCFMIEPSAFCRRSLRRYSEQACSHNASIHDVTVVIDPQVEGVDEAALIKGEFAGDPRWPKECPCGYAFRESDHWQVHADRLYRGAPDGKLYTLRDPALPIGAMWDAEWMKHMGAGPDGLCLVLKLPGGADWPMDVDNAGHRWNRDGIPPIITAAPSINHVGVYHGYVLAGVLSEDVEGRTFPGIPRTA